MCASKTFSRLTCYSDSRRMSVQSQLADNCFYTHFFFCRQLRAFIHHFRSRWNMRFWGRSPTAAKAPHSFQKYGQKAMFIIIFLWLSWSKQCIMPSSMDVHCWSWCFDRAFLTFLSSLSVFLKIIYLILGHPQSLLHTFQALSLNPAANLVYT